MSERRNRTGTVLITGFGRFPGAPFNPSAPLARALGRVRRPAFADWRLVSHVFPTSYAAVDRELPPLLAQHQPDILLMFGVAPKSKKVRIETTARNVLSRFPDAARFSPGTAKIVSSAPAKIVSGFPKMRLLAAARTRRCPAVLSRNAGQYLCNYVYWRGLEAAAKPGGPKLAAFIHLPPIAKQGSHVLRRKPKSTMIELLNTAETILAALTSAAKRPH
jgi:pyroglutamyl-peptidase